MQPLDYFRLMKKQKEPSYYDLPYWFAYVMVFVIFACLFFFSLYK